MRLIVIVSWFLAALCAPSLAKAQDAIFAETEPVVLSPDDPSVTTVGKLIYRGGLEIAPGEDEIGGISGITWHEGKLYAVSDDGHWLTVEPDEINGQLVDLLGVERGRLLDERGKRLRGKENTDAEAIARMPQDRGWAVAFERNHRVLIYSDLSGPAQVLVGSMDEQPLTPAGDNSGMETLSAIGQGVLNCMETHQSGAPNCYVQFGERDEVFELAPPLPLAEHNGVPTDAACKADGTCYVLFRSYRAPEDGGEGNRAAIVEYLAANGETRVLAVLTAPLTLDNFEGLALREQFGKTFLYLASDNNFSDNQRNLLMKFEVMSEEQLIAATPKPVVEYATQDVVLETAKGAITIRLETERAPITAANFLRYVDEGRFDGTVFYRAMKLNREPMPNGLIQGGTQFDPKRILPGIPHEPTTETGLSHTNGAVSMAMLEPGTANGDFSIMLADQTGLDARPDAEEEVWQNGYAVFGYVIDGMDVVSAIHAGEADPSKGVGPMVGQILADPVEVIKARRADPPPDQQQPGG